LARFGSIRLALKHDVLHAELGIATHCCYDLLHRTTQGIFEETRLPRLQVGEPEADAERPRRSPRADTKKNVTLRARRNGVGSSSAAPR
jgi:hypothetical protein